MPRYQFLEKCHIYTTVEANSEEEAWMVLDTIKYPLSEDPRVSYDSVQCEINDIWEETTNG